MIVREREPIVYTTSSSEDWSMASVILAIAIVALLGFMVYYFAVMHAARVMENPTIQPPTVIQQPVPTPVPTPVITPVTVPQPVLVPTPVQTAPAPAPAPAAPSNESSNQSSDENQ